MFRSELGEVARRVQIGAQLLGGADAREVADPGQPEPGRMVPRPKADGTLLAVVPIPGTGTSMAIVGYPVSAPGALAETATAGADQAERNPQRPGLLLDHDQRRGLGAGAGGAPHL